MRWYNAKSKRGCLTLPQFQPIKTPSIIEPVRDDNTAFHRAHAPLCSLLEYNMIAREEARRVRREGFEMPTALVIDDDPSASVLVHSIATRWTVLTANDGVAGLELARRYVEQLALVLLDMDLPGIGGYNTCLLLRAVSPTLHILPITVDATPIPLLAELGCLPPLVKPLGRGALRAA
jgi:CheY-like chemotaxis protein